MKLIILFFLTLSLLHADFVEEYIQKKISIEQEVNLHENNMTAMESEMITDHSTFMPFFLEFVGKVKSHQLREHYPYRSEIFKLSRRIDTNTQLANNYAVKRDELKMASFKLKQNMRDTLYKVVSLDVNDYNSFEKKLQAIILKRHEIEPKVNLRSYDFVRKIKKLDPLTQSVLDNLREYIALQDIHNNLSAILIEDSHAIYKSVVLSGFGILSFALHIEDSALAQKITPYLNWFFLSTSQLFFIVTLIVLALFIRLIFIVVFRRFFGWWAGSSDDSKYLISMTTRPFNLLLTVVVLEMLFLVMSPLSNVDWIFTAFKVVYVLVLTFLSYRLYNAIAVVKMEQMSLNQHVRNEVVNLGLKMMNVLIGLIALVWILHILGVNLTALLSGLGIGGVAVAFAAKDTIANFFGSISILLSDMFEQGDWIEIDSMQGIVVEIGLRATTIRTFDNALIAIPNFKLADNGIKNWSRRKMGRRIKMNVGVTYESDMDDIKKAIEQMRDMLQEHPLLMSEKTQYMNSARQMKLVSKEDLVGIKRQIMVYLDNYSASSIDILIYCFSRSVIWSEWHEAKEDVMYKVADILKENNLGFAYPTMMIHQAETELDEEVEFKA